MRTNIEIDETLLHRAIQKSGAPTKKAVVDTALRLLMQTHSQTSIRQLRGKIRWQGDLNQSRLGRVPHLRDSLTVAKVGSTLPKAVV